MKVLEYHARSQIQLFSSQLHLFELSPPQNHRYWNELQYSSSANVSLDFNRQKKTASAVQDLRKDVLTNSFHSRLLSQSQRRSLTVEVQSKSSESNGEGRNEDFEAVTYTMAVSNGNLTEFREEVEYKPEGSK